MSKNPAITERDVTADVTQQPLSVILLCMGQEGSPRSSGQEMRRRQVLAAAMHMGAEGGYDAVQMRGVADRSGVALGTIYRYFSSKDDLLIAGLAGWIRRTRKRLEEEEVRSNSPHERLAVVLAGVARSTEASPMLMDALLRAHGSTSPASGQHKLDVETEQQALIVTAIGDSYPSAHEIARVLGHVWQSGSTRWVTGLAPDGSLGADFCNAIDLLVPAMAVE